MEVKMKRIFLLICFVSALPIWAFAAQLYGNLKYNGQPVRSQPLEINCNGNVYTGSTDASGDYRLFAKDKGKCIFKISYLNQDLTFDVFSYDSPVRYDFEIVMENGKPKLRRK
jgi:hypothetical protein